MKTTRILFWSGLLGLALVTLMAVKSFAYDATGNESPPSAEASFTPAAPGALRFILSGTITLIPAP